MPASFSAPIVYNKQPLLAIVLPQLRRNGMHYEVNINGFPRFYMAWSQLGRYDIAPGSIAPQIPYELVLAVSDAIEAQQ